MDKRKIVEFSLLLLILLWGATLGFHGIDWDAGHHLHPDERFLTMVVTSLTWPESWENYLDESKSPLNPRNVGHDFFVYGALPTTLVKGLSIIFDMAGYDRVHLLGRAVSTIAFVGSILFLFLLAQRIFQDSRIALLSSSLFSVTVLPIQQAHFFTVDSLCAFFTLGAVYWLVRVQQTGNFRYYFLTGLFFGLALASKLSVFTFALVVAAVGIERAYRESREKEGWRIKRMIGSRVFGLLVLCGFITFLVFRVAQPDAFSGPGFFGLMPSERWLANMQEARRLVSGEIDTPPGHQWTNRAPILFPLKNMILWGMGPLLGVTAWLGWGAALWNLVRQRSTRLLVPVLWVGILFLHQGAQWVKSMRYTLPIYPLLALLAGWLLVRLWDRALEWKGNRIRVSRGWEFQIGIFALLLMLVPILTLAWAMAFSRIYTRSHTRVEASEWILENIPVGATLGVEHWDDALPLALEGHRRKPNDFVQFRFDWYAEETPKKLKNILFLLDRTEYIVLSSNRLYDSIPRLPMRYPMTINYYHSLFDGSLGFERAAEFTSYPGLFGLDIPDQSAEEAFTVYDHPRVQIFKKTDLYSSEATQSILGDVDWDRVENLTPRQVTAGLIEEPGRKD